MNRLVNNCSCSVDDGDGRCEIGERLKDICKCLNLLASEVNLVLEIN